MEKTDSATMDEIIAGYAGEDKFESTMADLSEFQEFVEGVLKALLEFINYVKELLGM